ncbi:MAG: hypothetical protein AAF551_09060 [Bacteroidota bacterium]
MKLLLTGVIFFMVLGVSAQNTRSANAPVSPKPVYQSVKKEKKGMLGAFKKKRSSAKSNEVAEFRARLQKVYKQKAKEAKLADKKRYKDPTYFGHKRKPKKRPVGKQKFCKICRIKH